MTRREFLLFTTTLALGLLNGAGARVAGAAVAASPALRCFNQREWATLDALAMVFWPAAAGRPDGRVVGVASACDRLFEGAHPGLQRELKLALWLWEWGPYLHGEWCSFGQLSMESRLRYAEHWRTSAIGLCRRLYVALQRLCAMVYHMQPATWQSMGYGGPWVGRLDVGLGLDNQGAMAANPNPNVLAVWVGDGRQ